MKLIYGKKFKEHFKYISIIFIIISIIAYVLVHALWNESFFLRILMGAPAAIFTGIGFYIIAKDGNHGILKSISNRLYAMAGLFTLYGIKTNDKMSLYVVGVDENGTVDTTEEDIIKGRF